MNRTAGIAFLFFSTYCLFAQGCPDYSDDRCWAALPEKNDGADLVPLDAPVADSQASADADVFFIHPTTCYDILRQNARIDDEKVNSLTDRTTIQKQASVFNGCCRIYAPRYRQASLYVSIDKKNLALALDLAYGDIKKAFRFYLENCNGGRPIVIASHSQGTWHAVRLLKDFFEDDAGLRDLLVAAYLIGGPVHDGEFKNIPGCDSADQLGCYVTWNTVLSGCEPAYKNCRSVNPLTWTRDTATAGAEMNIGGVPRTFDRIDRRLVGAKCAPNGALWIDRPAKRGYPGIKNFHLCDYALFYMNLRQNVRLRVEKWKTVRDR
jgi:hypothetical protein